MSNPPLPHPGAAHSKLQPERGRHTLCMAAFVQHPAVPSPFMAPKVTR
jgi:hypothetical protein